MSQFILYIKNDTDLPDKIFQGPFTEKITLDKRHGIEYRPISPEIRSEITTDEGLEYKDKIDFLSRFELNFIVNTDIAIFLSRLKLYDEFYYTDYRGETIVPDEWDVTIRTPDDVLESHFRKVSITIKYDLKSKYARENNYVEADLPNTPPYATNVYISGGNTLGALLTGNYTYNDDEGDTEGAPEFRWFRADDATGTNTQLISGASSQTYTIQLADLNKFVKFQVKPVASTGETEGDWAGSDWFTIGTNSAPVASSVSIDDATPRPGDTVNGSYVYSDLDGDSEGSSIFRYYTDDGGGFTLISEGTTAGYKQFTPSVSDVGKDFKFSVIPVATSGITPGVEVFSTTGTILPEL